MYEYEFISELNKLEDTSVMTLQEQYRQGADIWEEEFDLIDAVLYTHMVPARMRNNILYTLLESKDSTRNFEVGDVVYVPKYKANGVQQTKGRKLLIITARDEDGTYTGHPFLTNYPDNPKANKFKSKYPHNLYIRDYATIMQDGPKPNREAFIRVDELDTWTDEDFSQEGSGTWKGHVKPEFFDFVMTGRNNFKSGNHDANSKLFWE